MEEKLLHKTAGLSGVEKNKREKKRTGPDFLIRALEREKRELSVTIPFIITLQF